MALQSVNNIQYKEKNAKGLEDSSKDINTNMALDTPTNMDNLENVEYKEVKYELNNIENLKKAKSNLNRNKTISRIITNDTNVRFDVHPGVYLIIKQNTDKLKKGDETVDDLLGVRIKVTMVRRKITKTKKDNPEASVWYEVTDLRSGVSTKCVQHMYHTNQKVHLQGGQRIGKVTTTSMVADYLEKEWADLVQTHKDIIERNTEAIANIDINKFETELKNKGCHKQKDFNAKPKHECDMCDYKSVFQYEMVRHMYMKHDMKTDMKRKISDSSSPKTVPKTIMNSPISPPYKKSKEDEDPTDKTDKSNISESNVEKDKQIENLNENIVEMAKRLSSIESELISTQDLLKETITERDLIQSEYDKCYKANEGIVKEKKHLEEEFKEAVANLRMATRRNVELEETLSVTENIMKERELEEDDEDAVVENAEESDSDQDDEEDWVENEPTGKLYPAKVGITFDTNMCKKCDKIINNTEEMGSHMRSHMKKSETVKCHYCIFASKDGNQLINHISDIHFNSHICITCGNKFSSKEQLNSHVATQHTPKPPPKDKCSVCGNEYTNVEQLIEHIIRDHHHLGKNTNENKICLTCGNKFETKDEFIGHVVTEHAMKPKNHKCSTCDQEFNDTDNLNLHIIRQHSLIENDQSTVAGRQLKQVWPIDKAVSLNHKCFQCGHIVHEQKDLIKHKRESHYKQKMCNSYSNYGYCRFTDEDCIYIHNTNGRTNYNNQQPTRANNIQCWHGESCSWRAANRCNFQHNTSNVQSVLNHSNQGMSSGNTSEWLMRSIIDRLENIENKVPNIRSATDFPQLPEQKKSQ